MLLYKDHVSGSVGMSERTVWVIKQAWTAASQEGKGQSLVLPFVHSAPSKRPGAVSVCRLPD